MRNDISFDFVAAQSTMCMADNTTLNESYLIEANELTRRLLEEGNSQKGKTKRMAKGKIQIGMDVFSVKVQEHDPNKQPATLLIRKRRHRREKQRNNFLLS